MRIKIRLLVLSIVALVGLMGCSPASLSYRLDPEVNNVQRLSNHAKLVSVSVTDNRQQKATAAEQDIIIASGPEDEAKVLRTLLIDNFKKNNFKIINNPLLADLSIEIQIEQLEARINKSMFKSEVKVSSHLRLKAKKQSQSLEKLFKMNRNQEVANPPNELDVTGVVNQLLSNQLSSIFADPALIKLAES